MTYIWMTHTEHSHTLFKQHPDYKIPQRMAWVSPTFMHEGAQYRATVHNPWEEKLFPTLQEAKDWAQAVVLLTH